ncbi:MAG TPA: SET domain-containing protein-lysine N-methyltransferase [Gemmatales bacterium]|nr:SET domain-containing protein-lysine N-methyltransferase [Gemmatales bacterium]
MGVFASRDIEEREVVEVAPVIQVQTRFNDLETDLKRRVFNWERLASRPGMSAIALGYGSMYNHDNPANMQYASANEGQAILFVAVRTIRCGEELTINYNRTGGEPVSFDDIWFRTCGIVFLRSDSNEDCLHSPKRGDQS